MAALPVDGILLKSLAVALLILAFFVLGSYLAGGGGMARSLAQDFLLLSRPAYRAVEAAIAEARRLEHKDLGSEHLLLGIMLVDDCLGRRILEALGVEAYTIRDQVEAMVWKTSGRGVENHILFTVNFVQAIRLAIREARRLHYPYAGTQHLLLGLLRDTEGVAARLLGLYEITFEAVETAIVRLAEMEEPQ